MPFTNYDNIPLPLAVWLAANDGYDLQKSAHVVSATSLMKPTKSLLLEHAVRESPTEEMVVDIADLVPSRLGTAVHTAAEVAWLHSKDNALRELGYPQKIIDAIKINPTHPSEDPALDVYLEQRTSKAVGKWIVSGKFDFVMNGRVMDIKTTKTYNWIKGSNDDKYALQGSIYRWLNPEIITDDYVDIMMVFTDWTPLKAMVDKDYPKKRIIVRSLPLLSLEETERWVKTRLAELERYEDKTQADMPMCTPDELWMDPPKYAYYKNPKAAKATRVFNTPQEANAMKARDGMPNSKVVERKSEPKFCKYCGGRQICLQAEQYVADGLLKL